MRMGLCAHLTFWQLRLSPSPPQTCGGEGRGEEVRPSSAPLPIPLPARRGEGTLSYDFKTICQKVRCARCRPTATIHRRPRDGDRWILVFAPDPITIFAGLAAVIFFGPADGVEEKFPIISAAIMRGLAAD